MIEEIQKRNKAVNIAIGIISKSIKFFLIVPLLIILIAGFIYPVSYLGAIGIQMIINLVLYIIKLYRNDNTNNRLTTRV